MTRHAQIARALRGGPGAPAPEGLPEARFAVYRNNVAVALTEALGDAFPAVKALVGEPFFAAMARAFAAAHPPRSPVLAEWGDALPGWIPGFAPAASLPWLAEVAQVERLALDAQDAPDAPALDPAEAARATAFVPHPAARWRAPRWPVADILAQATADPAPWSGQGPEVVLTRPELAVQRWRAPAGTSATLDALRVGRPLPEALSAAADPAAVLTTLLASGALRA